MKEYEVHTSKMKWPQLGTVEVGPVADFVYIMRKDGNFVMSPIAQKFAEEYLLDEETAKGVLLEEYDTFFSKLADIFLWGFSPKGNVELHLYNPNKLDNALRTKAGVSPIVSLDPLMQKGVYEFRVSRGFYLGGKKDFSQITRPGNEPLEKQAETIAGSLGGVVPCVAEDDIFSGGSVIASLESLRKKGVHANKIVPGIQVGQPYKLEEMGIEVDPVVRYQTTDGTDIFDKVDLGDPRDFLLGASGLVVKLPNGKYGRAPYILPFVSTAARASIPKELEKEFAQKVLQASFEFFQKIEEKLGKPVLLKHMDNHFLILMHEMYGFDNNASMQHVIVWAMDNLDFIWEITQQQGKLHEKLEALHLPQNIVFLDVNGTLVPEEATDDYIPQEDIEFLKAEVAELKKEGVSVGICSDSPLPQLKEFAGRLGLDGPIVAESGNLLHYNGQTLILSILEGITSFKEQIVEEAEKFGLQKTDDCVAPEFGGKPPLYEEGQWSFGANRESSLSVFGPQAFIHKLGEIFKGDEDFGLDCSPEYNYFALHQGCNYKSNKGKTLSMLAGYGYNVLMIGNSMSDWADLKSGVKCAFVAESRITPDVSQKACFISEKPLMIGVVDILSRVSI